MVFEDVTFLQNLNENELQKYIITPNREKNSSNLFRSALMLSAHNIKHLNKIDNLSADIVIINLEDGVAKELKSLALRFAGIFISNLKKANSKIVVRINPLYDGGIDEIAFLNSVKPDAIRVPKIKTMQDVEVALSLIDSEIEVDLSIETKEALHNLTTLRVENRVKRVYLGILDLLESLNLPQSILKMGNPTIDYILSKFLIDSKIVGFYPISFVFQEYENLSEFNLWCEYEKSLGFEAKGCISPKQVEIANEIFSISNEAFLRAEYIKNRFEAMREKAITGFSDEKYGFIDEPIYKDALNILKKGKK